MKRNTWIIVTVVVALAVGTWAFMRASHQTISKNAQIPMVASEKKSEGYWTCPMHPQIHQDHTGECPICHMKLVLVKSQSKDTSAAQGETRSTVQVTQEQIKVLGIQKYEVEKMTLQAPIPVAGRFISSNAVAFQIYESDLRYVKPGLTFKGESSFYPEEEVVGIISSVDSIVDPTSRTVRVVGSIRKGPRGVASETGFRGNIELELKDRIAIPESSVLHTGQGDLVYMFGEDNQLTPKTVKLGLKSEGFYEVVSGLKSADVISSGPNFLVDSESKIRAASMPSEGDEKAPGKSTSPSCPKGEHWDIPMSMCMPGEK